MAGGPHTIKAFSYVKGLKVMAKLQDVLFGDVWICNGQSNMELAVRMVSTESKLISGYHCDYAQHNETNFPFLLGIK